MGINNAEEYEDVTSEKSLEYRDSICAKIHILSTDGDISIDNMTDDLTEVNDKFGINWINYWFVDMYTLIDLLKYISDASGENKDTIIGKLLTSGYRFKKEDIYVNDDVSTGINEDIGDAIKDTDGVNDIFDDIDEEISSAKKEAKSFEEVFNEEPTDDEVFSNEDDSKSFYDKHKSKINIGAGVVTGMAIAGILASIFIGGRDTVIIDDELYV